MKDKDNMPTIQRKDFVPMNVLNDKPTVIFRDHGKLFPSAPEDTV